MQNKMLLLSNAVRRSCAIERLMSYYGVANGRMPGVYKTWSECEAQVKGFKGAKYRKFPTFHEAEQFVAGSSTQNSVRNYNSTSNRPMKFSPKEIIQNLGSKLNPFMSDAEIGEHQKAFEPKLKSTGTSINEKMGPWMKKAFNLKLDLEPMSKKNLFKSEVHAAEMQKVDDFLQLNSKHKRSTFEESNKLNAFNEEVRKEKESNLTLTPVNILKRLQEEDMEMKSSVEMHAAKSEDDAKESNRKEVNCFSDGFKDLDNGPIKRKKYAEETETTETSQGESAQTINQQSCSKMQDSKAAGAKTSDMDFWPLFLKAQEQKDHITDAELLHAEKLATQEVSKLQSSINKIREITQNLKRKHESQLVAQKKTCDWGPVGIVQLDNFDFHVDQNGFIIVYTDGACSNNGKPNASAGYGVYFGDNHPLNVGNPVVGRVTNNSGEIQAALHAIRTSKLVGIQKLCISTDSQFLIKAVTEWIPVWKKNNWSTKSGTKVKNVDDLKLLDNELKDELIEVKWQYVPGHRGIRGNELADKLAREGAKRYAKLYGIESSA